MYFNFVGERIMLEKLLDDLTETPRKIANLENTISNEANLFEHQSSKIQRVKEQNKFLVEKIEALEKKLAQFEIIEEFLTSTKGLFLSAEKSHDEIKINSVYASYFCPQTKPIF